MYAKSVRCSGGRFSAHINFDFEDLVLVIFLTFLDVAVKELLHLNLTATKGLLSGSCLAISGISFLV